MKAPTPSALFLLAALALCRTAMGAPPSPVAPGAPASPAVPSSVSSPAPLAAPPQASLPLAPAVPDGENIYLEGLAMMRQKRYERALERFVAAWKEKPGHPGVEQNFPAALEGLKKTADEAMRQGRLGEAGKRWAAALGFLHHPAMKGKSLSFGKQDLKAFVERVTEKLLEKGLADYRQGRLESAIADWRLILGYDPGNVEAAKSIRTATTQLENLKKIPPPRAGK